jgi:hypothetical protein
VIKQNGNTLKTGIYITASIHESHTILILAGLLTYSIVEMPSRFTSGKSIIQHIDDSIVH